MYPRTLAIMCMGGSNVNAVENTLENIAVSAG